MNLDNVVLAIVMTRPDITGYDISKTLDTLTGSSHQSVYNSLEKLESKGLIIGTSVEQDSKPNKIQYHAVAKAEPNVKAKPIDFRKTSEGYCFLIHDLLNDTNLFPRYVSMMTKGSVKVINSLNKDK